ncbi:hypothetical protein [Cardinium endosymbiont of Sogatella furcifera]|uniref:hypothetical protein n=1 Tax=Cardinium endosymbiont of Sogatella furcifera TaxID=650378 RepID=UPI0013B3C251|nr:hypothetical protein [Cardinium endosymbiont of Sogatella furcifera]
MLTTSSNDRAEHAMIETIIACSMFANKQKMIHKRYAPAQLFRVHLEGVLNPGKIDLVDSKHIQSLFSCIDVKDDKGAQECAKAIVDIMFNPKKNS